MKKVFILTLLLSLLPISLPALEIVKDGKPAAVIVLGRRTKSTLLALEVLQHAVEKCTGVKLQMIRPKELASVPADLNRQIKEQFSDYISNFLSVQAILSRGDESALADFGTYMDYYSE